jgi:hypothetical protein
VTDGIAAMIARAQPPLTQVAVQIRTQTTPWQPQSRVDVLSLEEQSLVSVLAARLNGVSVSCPQILGRRPPIASAMSSDTDDARQRMADGDRASAILDVVLCVNGDATAGCATLLASDDVVRDSHIWPTGRAASAASPPVASILAASPVTPAPAASPAAANEPPSPPRRGKRSSSKKASRR